MKLNESKENAFVQENNHSLSFYFVLMLNTFILMLNNFLCYLTFISDLISFLVSYCMYCLILSCIIILLLHNHRFNLQSAMLRKEQQMPSKWNWTLPGHRYPRYVALVAFSITFCSILISGQLFSSYRPFKKSIPNGPKWPRRLVSPIHKFHLFSLNGQF